MRFVRAVIVLGWNSPYAMRNPSAARRKLFRGTLVVLLGLVDHAEVVNRAQRVRVVRSERPIAVLVRLLSVARRFLVLLLSIQRVSEVVDRYLCLRMVVAEHTPVALHRFPQNLLCRGEVPLLQMERGDVAELTECMRVVITDRLSQPFQRGVVFRGRLLGPIKIREGRSDVAGGTDGVKMKRPERCRVDVASLPFEFQRFFLPCQCR